MKERIAVICEYNPFHLGHKYQLEQIKIIYPDCDIICIMSGNVCQRGEFAILDKYKRAEVAVNNGADAVFELPYPYSGSTAEIFAKSGVYLASMLGASRLCFGTNELDIEKINSMVDMMQDPEYEKILSDTLKDKSKTYLNAKQSTFEHFGYDIPKDANDILALEYVRAIRNGKYNIVPHAIKRIGAKYNDYSVCEIMSAGAVRKNYYDSKIFISVPDTAGDVYKKEHNKGYILNLDECLKTLFRYVLISSDNDWRAVFDCERSLANFICNTARKSKDYIDFANNLSSKNFTSSRIKRTILYSLFGINDIDKHPPFTVLLACNENGCSLVGEINKIYPDFVLTKIADYKKMSPKAKKACEINIKVDQIYNTLLYKPKSIKDVYNTNIYIKK